MTVTAKGLDGSSGKGVEEEDTSAGFVKYCPIVLITKCKVSLLGVDSLWAWLHVYSGRLGVIVVDLCYFALFEDFSL